jgi:glycosyltransferase involved in cell wall biosynthesis
LTLKYSILLPTRNRLEYLRLAVESVLRQDVTDWQLVISDNASEQDIGGFVDSLDDPRIVYSRAERLLPVTENWNRALDLSEGSYVVMLGDDDALLDGYLRRMDELTAEFADPDMIYTKALLFTYPGVDPEHPGGFLMDYGDAEFFQDGSRPFVLDRTLALDAVRGAMSFRLRNDYNAQFALISRNLIDALGRFGSFYQSAFPDFYSMNAAFLHARRILIDPQPRVVIGVTPKSYGYFHVNRMEDEGRAFLEGERSAAPAGTNINVGWLSAMTALERGPAAGFGLRVSRRRYRFVQAAHVYEQYRGGLVGRDEVRRLDAELPAVERWTYRLGSAAVALIYRLVFPKLRASMVKLAGRLVGQLPERTAERVEGRYRNVLEICEAYGSRNGFGDSGAPAPDADGQKREQLDRQGAQEQ